MLIVLPAFAGKRQDLGGPELVFNLEKKKKIISSAWDKELAVGFIQYLSRP